MPSINEPGSHPVGLNPVFSIPQIYEAILKNLPVGFSLVDKEGIIRSLTNREISLAGSNCSGTTLK